MAKAKPSKNMVSFREEIPAKKWVTLSEAARLVGITRGVFWYHVQRGNEGIGPKIHGTQFGGDGRWLFDLDSVYQFKQLPRNPGRKKAEKKKTKKSR